MGWRYPTLDVSEVEEKEEEFNSLPTTHKVIFLRDRMKWSWTKITRFLYPHLKGIEFKKTMLKLYGDYLFIKRYMKTKELISFSIISPPKLDELIDERDYLIKMLGVIKDEERRKEIYRRLNLVKGMILFHLILWRFNLEKDSGKIFGVFNKLKERVDWDKDHVKMSGPRTVEWCSDDVSSLIIVSVVVGVGVIPKIKDIVEFLTNGNGRKKRSILKIVMEKYGDVVSQSVLLPFFS